jgi:hypothetical protein
MALDVGVAEIIAFEQQRVGLCTRQRVGEAVAEVEGSGMAAFNPEMAY